MRTRHVNNNNKKKKIAKSNSTKNNKKETWMSIEEIMNANQIQEEKKREKNDNKK